MTAQNVLFLAVLAVAGLAILFNFNSILHHIPLFLAGLAVAVGGLVYVTRQGMVDWDEWIPRGRE